MNPTRQTILHDKEAGLFGNCLQATLASLLHMPIDEVPHFCKIYPARWQKKLNEWLKPHGLAFLDVTGVEGVFKKQGISGCFHEISGQSPRDSSVRHSCVGRDGEWVFDPHPIGDGVNEDLTFGIFVALEPWRFVCDKTVTEKPDEPVPRSAHRSRWSVTCRLYLGLPAEDRVPAAAGSHDPRAFDRADGERGGVPFGSGIGRPAYQPRRLRPAGAPELALRETRRRTAGAFGGRLMDDDPDSLRTYDERAARDELREMRRTADRSREEQIYLLTGSVGAIKVDIADLKRALADHVGPGEEALINRAATRAVELVFANIGVDVNDPKDLQRFRDDLRFGAMIRTASQKGMIAALTAIVTAVVGAVWYTVTHLGHK